MEKSSAKIVAQAMRPSDGQEKAQLARVTKMQALFNLIEKHGYMLVADVRYELRVESWEGYDWIEKKNMYVTRVTVEAKGTVDHVAAT